MSDVSPHPRKYPGGREPIGEEPSVMLSLRVLASQREAWKAAAEAAGVTMSEWIRQTLDEAAGH